MTGDRTRAYWRSRWVAVLVAAAALGLAACGGGSSAPKVASLPSSTSSRTSDGTSGGSTPTAKPAGNPTKVLSEWTACMRSHGDPGQAEPTIDASKVIHIVMSPSVPGGLLGPNGQSGPGPVPGSYCGKYLMAASAALRGDQSTPNPPSQAQLLRYAKCMRANGIPDFPDPTAGGFQIHGPPGSDLNPENPITQKAAKVCVKETGVHAFGAGAPPPPGSIMEGPPGGPQQLALILEGDG